MLNLNKISRELAKQLKLPQDYNFGHIHEVLEENLRGQLRGKVIFNKFDMPVLSAEEFSNRDYALGGEALMSLVDGSVGLEIDKLTEDRDEALGNLETAKESLDDCRDALEDALKEKQDLEFERDELATKVINLEDELNHVREELSYYVSKQAG